ncbi:soluble inorganic pyrophosphatase-like protein [Corchorus olitorius]|uniref:Soluble inorganic pyrophosphatase-like protein n=1 Tax=Corchorus olitorius TaxID=93759 RepID=A0A1R3K350_9ROSI|nr:soluble inorganic pyrophosphatase-like protein [Corchorus olitorius]
MKDENGEPRTARPRPRLNETGTKVVTDVLVLAAELALSSSWYPADVAKWDPRCQLQSDMLVRSVLLTL